MSNPWYEVVPANQRLTQGDIIPDCPVLGWKAELSDVPETTGEIEVLQEHRQVTVADVVVMTQACDLEHDKVSNVVLCPHLSISAFKAGWEESMLAGNQNPTSKAWRNLCEALASGYVWNQSFLNSVRPNESTLESELRVVDFSEVFTFPRQLLERLLARRAAPRLRLLPPYREHLSQAFARFFMRVGLPTPIEKTW